MKTMDLFGMNIGGDALEKAPLAERMRPQNLSEYVGQPHLTGE